MVEEKNHLRQVVSDLHTCAMAHMHTIISECVCMCVCVCVCVCVSEVTESLESHRVVLIQ